MGVLESETRHTLFLRLIDPHMIEIAKSLGKAQLGHNETMRMLNLIIEHTIGTMYEYAIQIGLEGNDLSLSAFAKKLLEHEVVRIPQAISRYEKRTTQIKSMFNNEKCS